MSNFLSDLSDWALRGGAGDGGQDDDNNNNNDNPNDGDDTAASAGAPDALTPQEMRAQRLARMGMLEKQQREAAAAATPMEVDNDDAKAKHKRMESKPVKSAAVAAVPAQEQQQQQQQVQQPKKKKGKSDTNNSNNHNNPNEASRKLQRKKEALLAKTLQLALAGTPTARASDASSIVVLDIGSTVISVQTIAEILATRLSLPASATTTSNSQSLLAYLGRAYRVAGEELRNGKLPTELEQLLEEIKGQVVSYAATTLVEPELFEQGKDGAQQLADAFVQGVLDLQQSLALGGSHSFYHKLCNELIVQQQNNNDGHSQTLVDTARAVARNLQKRLEHCDSVLDGGGGNTTSGMNNTGSPMVVVSAMGALCSHKRAGLAVATMNGFLLPAAGTPQAAEVIRPTPLSSSGANHLFAILAGAAAGAVYAKRSGPALQKRTLLGVALGVGAPPKLNAAFPPGSVLQQKPSVVESIHGTQRQALTSHQNACYQLVWNLIRAGPDARQAVMRWFTDALLVNKTADAMQTDPGKVSTPALLYNVSIMLLKLCEPFVNDARKQGLIDPGFVRAARELFPTSGDDIVSRLGSDDDESSNTNSSAMDVEYNPENEFVPRCFFLCARSLHYGIVPQLSKYESLVRNISHLHWRMTSNGNTDLHSNPRLAALIAQQRSMEVALFQEDMVQDALTFGNFVAKVLFDLDDAALAGMPQDFVSDLCDVIMRVAKLKANLLRGMDVRYIFKLMVKLLSAQYASMVRNYNLRATMGDVLYELFMPPQSGDHRDIPDSLSMDPLAGGQTFLLSDAAAQETLAPSLLLLYGEVEYTGHYEKMSHRAKIASLIKYLWDSAEHRPAFRRITQDKDSFIKFANGIMNETNTLIATVMQTLPEIREAQEKMKNTAEWGRLSEDEQGQVTGRLGDNEREVKHALSLCNKTLHMFGYLNTDKDIRTLFLLEELCPRLVSMLLHVLTKLVGSKGLDLKVDNPEQYDFRPKEMLRDLCAIFALFAESTPFQVECAKAGCDPDLLRSAVKTCRKLNLLTGESMIAFGNLPDRVLEATQDVASEEALLADAPDKYLDPLLSTFMKDPVRLPSTHVVDRSTITQHLLNDPTDPFNRKPMTVDDIVPDVELKAEMDAWLAEQRSKASCS